MDRAAEKPATSMSRERQSPPNAGASADQATGSAASHANAPAAAGLAGRSDEARTSNAAPALAKRAQAPSPPLDEAAQRSVDEWIALIRRLKAEGKNDLAAKELAAFRARYPDRADSLLPADLREARP